MMLMHIIWFCKLLYISRRILTDVQQHLHIHAEVGLLYIQGGPKTDTQFYFGGNFGNSAPILTILSLLQAEMYGA